MPPWPPVSAGVRGGCAQRGQVDADQRGGGLPGVPVLTAEADDEGGEREDGVDQGRDAGRTRRHAGGRLGGGGGQVSVCIAIIREFWSDLNYSGLYTEQI